MKKVIFAMLFLLCCTSVFAHTKIDVLKVYDGDSILAKIDENIFRIRLIDIDCFEGTLSSRAKWQAKKYKINLDEVVKRGNLAGELLRKELKNKNVTFIFQGIDKYHRALGYLYIDNQNVNSLMLKSGYCEVYKK